MTETKGSRPRPDRGVTFLLVSVPQVIVGSLILIAIVINFANVVGRYVFLAPIIWAEEIMIYIMVWLVFIGAILATWDGRHLKMDLLSISLRPPWKYVVNAVAWVAFVLVCIFVLPQSYEVVSLMTRLGQRSVVAEIPMVVPHVAVLIGFVLILLAILIRGRAYITGTLESEIDELVEGYGEVAPDTEHPS